MSSSPNNPSSPGYQGLQNPSDSSTPFNATAFLVRAMMSKMATATVVRVVSVTNAGGVSPVGFVDILPLVNQVDGSGAAVPHGVIHGCPYSRLQGGANAVILDPQIDDIGVVVFASRDISSVIATKAQSTPGSKRMFDWADAIYIGGILNGVPTQFVEFNATGITIKSPTLVKIDAPDVQIACTTLEISATSSVTVTTPSFTVNGQSTLNGNAFVTGAAILEGSATVNGVATLQTLAVVTDASVGGTLLQQGHDVGPLHQHSGVSTGIGHSGPVV